MADQTIAQKRKIFNISLPLKLYEDVNKFAVQEDKTKAELVREAVREYLADRQDWAMIFKWGRSAAKKFGIKNEDDVERIVDEIRCQK